MGLPLLLLVVILFVVVSLPLFIIVALNVLPVLSFIVISVCLLLSSPTSAA